MTRGPNAGWSQHSLFAVAEHQNPKRAYPQLREALSEGSHEAGDQHNHANARVHSPFYPFVLAQARSKDSTPYEPPPVYAEWWAAAESCAHRHKDLHHWHWYAVKWPHLEIDHQGWEPGLSYERNEVYVRDDRTLDRTEVLSQMAWMLTPITSWGGGGDAEREFFQKTLTCVGITNASWSLPWRPNPS